MNKYRFLRFPDFKDKALTLSYDDGLIFDKKLIKILNEYGIKCTFNLNSGMFAVKTGDRRMTKEEAVSLYKDTNHEIAIHGAQHLSLADVPEEFAVADVIEDRKALEKLFGRIVKGMAYANGSVDDSIVNIVKHCGIKYARTTISSNNFFIPNDWLKLEPTCHHGDSKLMALADEFLKESKNGYFWSNYPKLFYLWGHSYEFDDRNEWGIIEEFAKGVGNRDDIWYATNGEVFDYVQAYNRLEFSVDGKIITNPTDKDVFLDLFGDDIKIAAGETRTIG